MNELTKVTSPRPSPKERVGRQSMGARTYNATLGRFMSVDPLFEAFPGQSPYSYTFNSPLSWSDPSGLAPEKEKKRDRVLTILLKDISNEIANIDRINGTYNDAFNTYIRAMSNASLDIILQYGMGAIQSKLFSGGNGGNRTGEATMTFNGLNIKVGLTGISVSANYTVNIPTRNGSTIKTELNVNHSGVSPGQTFNSVAQAYLDGINKILSLDAGYFDQLVGHKTTVLIKHSSEVLYKGKEALGLHTPISPGNSLIELPGDVLTGNKVHYYADNDDFRNRVQFQPYQMIAHEFSHAIHFALAGWNDFTSYHTNIKEYVAGTYENYLNQLNNTPLRDHGYGPPKGVSYILNNIFDPSYIREWEKFNRRGY
jgi:RHS repeat-associated protein